MKTTRLVSVLTIVLLMPLPALSHDTNQTSPSGRPLEDAELGEDGCVMTVRSYPIAHDDTLIIIEVLESTPKNHLRVPANAIDSVYKGVRTIVLRRTPDSPVDFTTIFVSGRLVHGRAHGERWKRPDFPRLPYCVDKNYAEDCVDCGAFSNRAQEYLNCGSPTVNCYEAECFDTERDPKPSNSP